MTTYTNTEQGCVEEFVKGFTEFMNDNPDIRVIFAEAWHNADNRTIRDMVDDYVMELEAQP